MENKSNVTEEIVEANVEGGVTEAETIKVEANEVKEENNSLKQDINELHKKSAKSQTIT